jgi:thiol-disulfide isomerase/thioredoxin
VLLAISAVLLAVNVCLIVQNFQLRNSAEQSKLFITEEGFRFSSIRLKGLDGREEAVDFPTSKAKTLLLVFNTSCQYCVQEYPYWKELARNLDKEGWRIFAVTSETDLDKIRGHIEEFGLTGIKIGSLPSEDARNARLLYTPMTLAIDSSGEVKKVWPGLWKKGFDLPN